MSLAFILSLVFLLPACLAYSVYKEKIPNANNVLHPCIPNYRWPGVGHKNRNGGGTTNVFGQHFATAGHQWTRSLCLQDSDSDGRSNGEELGDPACVWKPGQIPSRTVNITNPGVCDPMGAGKCLGKNNFVSCDVESFNKCDAIKDPDVKALDLRFPTFTVPASETNYMCMTFDLPGDQDYHIVADEGIINNSHVLHHMLLHGCHDSNTTIVSQPTNCRMGSSSCTSIIGGWTVGHTGFCYGNRVGFKIGTTGYRRVNLEIHYNNPFKVANYQDSSGLRLYYRPVRPGDQDLFTLTTGQLQLELQPGQLRIEKVGVCKSACSAQLLNKPVYLISALNHMHYLGSSMTIELYREGVLIKNLTNDVMFSYDSPKLHVHTEHVQILPGDEIVTRCVYNTISSKEMVYYGDSTADEMCFGFLTLYPKSAFNDKRSNCISSSSLSFCELVQGTTFDGCQWKKLKNPNDADTKKMIMDVNDNCNFNESCRPECMAVVAKINSSPCFQGEAAEFLNLKNSNIGLTILRVLESCTNCNGTDCYSNRSVYVVSGGLPVFLAVVTLIRSQL